MLFVLKTTYLIRSQHLPRLGKYSPDSLTFANLFCSDSPDSPTFAKNQFWKNCDSPRQICTSNERVTRIWGEWPLLTHKAHAKQKRNFILVMINCSLTFYVFFYIADGILKFNTELHSQGISWLLWSKCWQVPNSDSKMHYFKYSINRIILYKNPGNPGNSNLSKNLD